MNRELIKRLTNFGIQVYNPNGTMINKQFIINQIVDLHASIWSDELAEELLKLADEVDEVL
jgi:hypothetical protein